MPTPAMMVFPVESVGSRLRLTIDNEAWLLVSELQVAPLLAVIQMPPFGEAANIVPAPSAGSSSTDCTAPASVPFGDLSAPPIQLKFPCSGPGPCEMKV